LEAKDLILTRSLAHLPSVCSFNWDHYKTEETVQGKHVPRRQCLSGPKVAAMSALLPKEHLLTPPLSPDRIIRQMDLQATMITTADDPPLIQIEDFVSPADAKKLIAYARGSSESVNTLLGAHPSMRNNARADLFFTLLQRSVAKLHSSCLLLLGWCCPCRRHCSWPSSTH